MSRTKRNNDAINGRKYFRLFYTWLFRQNLHESFVAAGFSMHALEEYLRSRGRFVLKTHRGLRWKITPQHLVHWILLQIFCDWRAEVSIFAVDHSVAKFKEHRSKTVWNLRGGARE
jgi:hypothetical protein